MFVNDEKLMLMRHKKNVKKKAIKNLLMTHKKDIEKVRSDVFNSQ